MRVLAVGAHPDDLEILCGGTLARYARDGHDVVMCNATTGDRGSFVHTSRGDLHGSGSTRRGARPPSIGAEHATLGLSDGEVNAADPEQKRLVVDLVRDARPDVVITHYRERLHGRPQRDLEARLRVQLLRDLRRLETERPHHDRVTPIYYMDTVVGVGFVPDRVRRRQRRRSTRRRPCSRRTRASSPGCATTTASTSSSR